MQKPALKPASHPLIAHFALLGPAGLDRPQAGEQILLPELGINRTGQAPKLDPRHNFRRVAVVLINQRGSVRTGGKVGIPKPAEGGQLAAVVATPQIGADRLRDIARTNGSPISSPISKTAGVR